MTARLAVGRQVLELVQGDITRQRVDAIVNAANARLAGGGGVDGAIHSAGGPEIMQETARCYPNGCQTGSAVITSAGRLGAQYVIHAVGPVWHGGNRGEAALLAGAYQASLELAVQHDCKSIAFPAISTGAYGYPLELAARVAVDTALEFLRQRGQPELVRFVLFSRDVYEPFADVLEEVRESESDS